MTPLVDVLVDDPAWREISDDCEALALNSARIALDGAGFDEAQTAEISVLLTDDARISTLNQDFRGKATPTNVLSWPAFDLNPESHGEAPPPPQSASMDQPMFLGDIALARETVLKEAAEQGKSPSDHATHLIVHAVLHLLGYDHETDADARLMEGIETAALLRAGLPDPYMERTGANSDMATDRNG